MSGARLVALIPEFPRERLASLVAFTAVLTLISAYLYASNAGDALYMVAALAALSGAGALWLAGSSIAVRSSLSSLRDSIEVMGRDLRLFRAAGLKSTVLTIYSEGPARYPIASWTRRGSESSRPGPTPLRLGMESVGEPEGVVGSVGGWVRMPVLAKTPGLREMATGTPMIGLFRGYRYSLKPSRDRLRVVWEGALAEARLGEGDLVVISYTRLPGSGAGEVALYLEAEVPRSRPFLQSPRVIMMVARLDSPGKVKVRVRGLSAEDHVIVFNERLLTIRSLLDAVGLEAPVIVGSTWLEAEAVLRLVMYTPRGRVEDSCKVEIVRPGIGTEHPFSFNTSP